MSQTPAALHWFTPLGLGRTQGQWGRALGAIALMGLTACGLQSDGRYGDDLPRADLTAAQTPITHNQAQDVARSRLPESPAQTELTTPPAPDPRNWAAATIDPAKGPELTPDFTPEAQDHRGRFRVGNQTEHPIRIAFLPQHPDQNLAHTQALAQEPALLAEAGASEGAAGLAAGESPSRPALDLEPSHWDFAPGEGASNGLLLSLPGGDLDLQQGDVLVAFAQDGSSRYWGPYVVGQTQLPYWDSDRQEWQLLIQP